MKISVLLVLGLCLFMGCSSQQDKTYTMEDLDSLAKVEIYSAENNELIKTITDEEMLYQYNQWLSFSVSNIEERQDELKKNIEGATEQYHFISYKYSVARFSRQEMEENLTITLYENSNIIKMTVSEESIKSAPIPQEFLIFYYEIPDENIAFMESLTQE